MYELKKVLIRYEDNVGIIDEMQNESLGDNSSYDVKGGGGGGEFIAKTPKRQEIVKKKTKRGIQNSFAKFGGTRIGNKDYVSPKGIDIKMSPF